MVPLVVTSNKKRKSPSQDDFQPFLLHEAAEWRSIILDAGLRIQAKFVMFNAPIDPALILTIAHPFRQLSPQLGFIKAVNRFVADDD